MKKVLLVDDELFVHELITDTLRGKAEVIIAVNAVEARQQFARHSDLSMIIMDGDLSNNSSTPDLVREFRQTFRGPMLAASGNFQRQRELLEAGCSHDARKPKTYRVVVDVLNGMS